MRHARSASWVGLTAVIVSLVVALGQGGCSRPAGPENISGGKADGKPRIALVMKSLANEFFATMADGAKAHQASAGNRYELITNGMRSETDVSEQVTLIEQMVARGVAAIVIAPPSMKAPVNRAAIASMSLCAFTLYGRPAGSGRFVTTMPGRPSG